MSYFFMNEILGWAVDDEIRVRRSLSLSPPLSLRRVLRSLQCCRVLASQRKERNRERGQSRAATSARELHLSNLLLFLHDCYNSLSDA